ncbi:MAG: hypothetical protein N0E56_15780 [Candidatus Thiodiazotropha endolucinida]|nr:hypothetical protein [Candidatus Thiodiazotropha taylori]MCW4268083.1 hypothetical protein [Candidatus Thiodiazotropha endolucinida]
MPEEMVAHTSCQAELGFPIAPGMVFRQTPPEQATVPQIIGIGSMVSTSYGTGPYRVLSIHDEEVLGYATHNLVCEKEGRKGHYYINELVAVNGRILHLFGNNDDEVILHGGGQLCLF